MDYRPGCTARDFAKLFIPFSWVIAATCMFCYYLVQPFVNGSFPKTIPLYWSLISALPAYMTLLNLFLFHRDCVKSKGLSRITISQLSKILRFVTFLGIILFLTLSITSAIQVSQCDQCVYDCYGEVALWFSFCVLWMIVMVMTLPRTAHLTNLIRRYDASNPEDGTHEITSMERPAYHQTFAGRPSDFTGDASGDDGGGGIVGGIPGTDVVTGKVTNFTKADQENDGIHVSKGEQLPTVTPAKPLSDSDD